MRFPRKCVLRPGDVFHKIWRCHDRQYLLQSHHEKLEYLNALRDDYQQNSRPEQFVMHGYCMMSNHAHEDLKLLEDVTAFSNHMRRAHSRFGQEFNQRHDRLGKVAHARPKTLRVQNAKEHIYLRHYIDCNPVRAGLIKTPTDILWRQLSTCRWYAYGEPNDFTDMCTYPDWYLALGKTPRARQSKYRSLLDLFMIDNGMKRDPKAIRGNFIGDVVWQAEMRHKLAERLKRLTNHSTGPPE